MGNNKRDWRSLLAVALAAVLWTTQPGFGLLVTEVMYQPTGNEETLEFIELYNNRAVFEDLSGYTFTNGIGYVFPAGTIIGPKSYLVVARDPAALENAYAMAVEGAVYAGDRVGIFQGRRVTRDDKI